MFSRCKLFNRYTTIIHLYKIVLLLWKSWSFKTPKGKDNMIRRKSSCLLYFTWVH